MKIKIRKTIVVAIISSVLITFSSTLNINAANDSEVLENFEPIISYDHLVGRSAQSTEELFSSDETFNASNPTLNNIKIGYTNETLKFISTLTYKGTDIIISTSGQMYKNEKTANSGNYGNLLLTEMRDIKGWHFVQFCINNENNQLLVILQNTSNYELLQFIINIDNIQYNNLYNLCENPIKGKELEEKIVGLYSVSKNLINDKISNTYNFKKIFSSTDINKKQILNRSTYNGYKDMIDKLKKNSKVKVNSLNNIDKGMFTGNGWQQDRDFGNGEELSYDFMTYSRPNGPDKFLVQMSLSYLIKTQEVLPNSRVRETLEYRYVDGMLLEYDTYFKELKVIYYDWGVRFRNLELAIGTSSENCFFTNSLINGWCSEDDNSLLLAIGGWFGTPGQVITDLFSALNSYESQPLNQNRAFPTTIEGQKELNGGKLIQVIAASSGMSQLRRSEHYLFITGEIKISKILNAYYSYKGEMSTQGM